MDDFPAPKLAFVGLVAPALTVLNFGAAQLSNGESAVFAFFCFPAILIATGLFFHGFGAWKKVNFLERTRFEKGLFALNIAHGVFWITVLATNWQSN